MINRLLDYIFKISVRIINGNIAIYKLYPFINLFDINTFTFFKIQSFKNVYINGFVRYVVYDYDMVNNY